MSPRAAFRYAEGWAQGSLRSTGRGKRRLPADERPLVLVAVPPVSHIRICDTPLATICKRLHARGAWFCCFCRIDGVHPSPYNNSNHGCRVFRSP